MSPRPPELTAAAAAPVFAALGDATRLALLARLCNGQPQSITELTRGTGLTRQGVSKHLTILEQARIITSERVGRESRFKVRASALQDARRYLDRASQQWDATIDRLKAVVESE